jgi:5-methylcytosine-specific restriction protein A
MQADRGTAAARGYDARWQRARKLFLSLNPLCRPCSTAGRITAATVVDHITAHKGDETLFWDQANWQPSCKPCHDARVDEGDFGRSTHG